MTAGRDLDAQLEEPRQGVELVRRARLAHQHVGALEGEHLRGRHPGHRGTDHDHAPPPNVDVAVHPRPPLLMKST